MSRDGSFGLTTFGRLRFWALRDILRSVISRAGRRPSISIALIMVALAGCPHEPFPPVTVPAPAAASSEDLRWVIEAALAARRWTIRERAPGAIGASVQSQGTGDHAVVEITYRPGVIDIRCVKQNVSRARYDRWIQLLSTEIVKNAAQQQMGRGRPPAPLPPSEAPSEAP